MAKERFEGLKLVGEGGMGRVFHATDAQMGGDVALKVLRHDILDPDAVSRFDREVAALARLHHPNIVGYVSHGKTADGAPFVAMQWLAGEELRARLKRGVLDLEDTLIVASRIADALAHAHAIGITHRDVKPSNILLVGSAVDEATLIDFGLARSGNDELTQTGAIIGTPTHMAPEQIRNEISPAVDVFALGCVIYQCLTGTPPFAAKGATAVLARILFDEPESLASLAPVPPALAELVDSMLRKAPLERPSMEDAAAVLRQLRASHSDPPTARASRDQLSQGEQRVASRDPRGGSVERDGGREAATRGGRTRRGELGSAARDRDAIRRRDARASERDARRDVHHERRCDRRDGSRGARGGLRARVRGAFEGRAHRARDGARGDGVGGAGR